MSLLFFRFVEISTNGRGAESKSGTLLRMKSIGWSELPVSVPLCATFHRGMVHQ